jgi:hypothetical protein
MYDTAWWGHMWIQPNNYVTSKKLKVSSAYFRDDWREWGMWFTG